MHGIELLHNWLGNACSFMHAARARALVKAVEGLLTGGQLTLTRIGRHLSTSAFTKHNIKCVDRLLGNRALWAERVDIYRAMARWLLNKTERPVLLIDWSDCAPGRAYLTLRAALPVDGRTVTVYEEVHRLENKNFKSPFSSGAKIRLNLSGVKHAQSRSGIGNDRASRRLDTPGFGVFLRLG